MLHCSCCSLHYHHRFLSHNLPSYHSRIC